MQILWQAFCGKRSPEVSFRQDAHAIPELLWNKSLFTYYECDPCNQLFGHGIENDFGNWSKPMRMLARIRGKTGVPTIKRSHQGWRIEGVSGGLRVDQGEADPVFEVDEDKREVTFKLPRDPYTPVAVLKAFVKIGLALLPTEEMANFQTALQWIRTKNHGVGVLFDWTVWQTLMPGAYRSDIVAAMVFRRKRDGIKLPYAFLVLMYGNEMFQVFLPAPDRDQHIEDKPLMIYRFPSLVDLHPSDAGLAESGPLNLTGTTVVKDDVVTVSMTYGQRLKAE